MWLIEVFFLNCPHVHRNGPKPRRESHIVLDDSAARKQEKKKKKAFLAKISCNTKVVSLVVNHKEASQPRNGVTQDVHVCLQHYAKVILFSIGQKRDRNFAQTICKQLLLNNNTHVTWYIA